MEGVWEIQVACVWKIQTVSVSKPQAKFVRKTTVRICLEDPTTRLSGKARLFTDECIFLILVCIFLILVDSIIEIITEKG